MKTLFISLILLSALFAQRSKIDSLENVVQSDATNIDAMFQLAKIYHDMVVDQENDDAVERAEELFKSILQKKGDHAEALVYYGSLLTIKGRDAFLPWKKLSYVEVGCDEMDKAVQLAPQNISLRITRAMNNINLPDFFNRQTYYLEDFEFIRNHPAFVSFPTGLQQKILFNSAKAFEKNEQLQKSLEMYQKVNALNENSEYGKLASQKLAAKQDNDNVE